MSVNRKHLYLLYFTLFQVFLGFGILVPILPHYVLSLGGNAVHMGLMVSAWAAAQFIVAPLWGGLSDRFGRRPILLVGLAGYGLTFGMMAIAGDIWMALLARLLGGVLSAATIPTAQAFVADTTSGEQRSTGMAGMGAAMSTGFIGGPAVGGLLAGIGLSYQHTFLAAGVMALLTWLITYTTLPESRHHTRARMPERKNFSGLQSIGMAIRSPEVLLYLLTFAATYGGSTIFSMLGLFLESRLHLGADMLGIAFTVQGILALLFQALFAGVLSRRFQDESIVRAALISAVFGFLIIIFASSFLQVIAGMVGTTFAYALVRPVVASMVSKRTKLNQGMAMGIQNSFDALGRTIAPSLAGTAFLLADWLPFSMAIGIYLLFLILIQIFWRRSPRELPPAVMPQ